MAEGDFRAEKKTEYAEGEVLPEDGSLLEEVVRETISGDGQPLSTDELEALRTVAQRHANSPALSESIAVELVESLLQLRFPAYDDQDERWRAMSENIAAALWDAPEPQSRLKGLWSLLCQSAT